MATTLEQAREVKHQRATLIKQNRDLNDKAHGEKREFTAEETAEYDKRFTDIETLGAKAERLEKLHAQESAISDDTEPRGGRPGTEGRDGKPATEYRTKVDARPGIPAVERVYKIDDKEAARAKGFNRFLRTGVIAPENRALENTDDTKGGYATPPMQFIADLIQAVDNAVQIRGLATVTPLTSGDSMGRPSLDADPEDADWTTELDTGTDDSTMAFGKRELKPNPLAKGIKVSKTLINRSAINMEALVLARLGYKFGVSQEKGFMTGNGASQPLGIFTASTDGISTGRDVSTDNTSTTITADGLINAKFSVKAAYWPKSRWIFHRDAVKMLTKLKDGEGRYLWSGSLLDNQPDRLLGNGVLISEYAPNTFTSGLYVGIFGDFSFYWIADALNMTVERLVELYARTNQLGFIGRLETDGMPTLEEAFARVKLG